MKIFKRITSIIICLFLLLCIPVSASDNTHRIRAGYFSFPGYHMQDEDGIKSGYGYEYLQQIASYADWTYDYIGYDKNWSEMQEMLKNGQIDILTSAQKTPEREELFAFSDEAIGHSAVIFTVRAGDTSYVAGDYAGYDGIRVGMLEDSSRNDKFQLFAEEHGFSYTPVYFESMDELTDALQNNSKIDAIVTSNLRKIEKEWVLDEFASSPFYVMVRKEDAELLDEVNAAIQQVKRYHPNLVDDLFEKYYTPSSGDEIAFTAEERRFIQEYAETESPLRVILNPDRAPLSWFEDGQPEGVFAQLGEKVLERAGLPYEIVETKNRQEYQSLKESGEYDIALDTDVDFNEAERLDYKLTEPYLSASVFQLTQKDFSGQITSVAALKGADVTRGFVEAQFPRENITYYDTVEDCTSAIKKGKQDAAYFYTYVAQSIIYNDETSQLVSSEIPGYVTQFAFSVRNSQDIRLLSILDKVLKSFGDDELNQLIISGTEFPQKEATLKAYMYSHPLILVSVITIVIFVILLIVFLLYKVNKRKNDKARLNEYERFISYVCKMNELVLEVDINTLKSWHFTAKNGKVQKAKISEAELRDLSGTLFSEDAEKLKEYLQKSYIESLIDQTAEFYFESRIKIDSPKPIWYAFTIQGLAKDSKHPNSIMILGHDIDLAKKEEEQRHKVLQDALAAAHQASETKSSFLSRMSHEMRTPLNAIIGYLELSKTHMDDLEKISDYIAKSEIAAHQLLSIINDVLDMASIESGKLHLERVQFELTEEIMSVKEMFQSQAYHKNLDFQVHIDSKKNVQIMGDPLRLNQILINLLSNAIKFTPANGKVSLTVTKTAEQDGRVYYRFEVADTGIGMTDKYMSHLFDPFEQQDASIARKFGGSGLGMSITKNLVTMKQGTISVKSQEGIGTVFTVNFSFDLVLDAENMNRTITKDRNYDFTGMRLLLAEDNQMNREIATEILTASGFKVDVAKDGQQAVDKFLSSATDIYSLILMDIQMPILDGYEATREIRASEHPKAKSIPIFAMTANAFTEDVNKALDAGMNGHIAKPLDVGKMMDVLAGCLEADERIVTEEKI